MLTINTYWSFPRGKHETRPLHTNTVSTVVSLCRLAFSPCASVILVRTVKFVPRMQWFITGSDDLNVRVFNYNTMEKVKEFVAHQDYIRSIAVHPTLPVILTSSDDTNIMQWNWEKGWTCERVYEGHTHYVMQVVFSPKDPSMFASASLDHSIKVWGLNTPTAHYTLTGHKKGVNTVGYFHGPDRPYLISGGDDFEVKIWDYQTKTCVQTLTKHTHNITLAMFHPILPVILTGSEDGSIRIWRCDTYRLEKTLNYGLDRAWCAAYDQSHTKVCIGFDFGTILLRLAKRVPVSSMDQNGKIVLTTQKNEIMQYNVRGNTDVADGEVLLLAPKELGTSDAPISSVYHDPTGRFVATLHEFDYIIYTSIAWRNKAFGNAVAFAWGNESGSYAVVRPPNFLVFHTNFEEGKSLRVESSPDGLYPGPLLGVRTGGSICFHAWEDGTLVRKIDVAPRAVMWSEEGDIVALASPGSFFVLRYQREVVASRLLAGEVVEGDGIEDAFELVEEIKEDVRGGQWYRKCFIFFNKDGRLGMYTPPVEVSSHEDDGEEEEEEEKEGTVVVVHHTEEALHFLRYLPKENRVFLLNKVCLLSIIRSF
jgi:coatomer subunit beta'